MVGDHAGGDHGAGGQIRPPFSLIPPSPMAEGVAEAGGRGPEVHAVGWERERRLGREEEVELGGRAARSR